MAKLYIEFTGICVHFRREFHPVLPVRHRVVLINGRNISHPIRGADIPPHYAFLRTPEPDADPIPLNGVTVRVRNQVDAPCTYSPNFALLPNLTDLAATAGETLGPPSMPVLVGENAALTSCYFDFNGGAFDACDNNESASVLATIETDSGDTENVTVDMTPFPSAPFPVQSLPVSLVLPSESVITVSNICEGTKDRDTDFYLSYLTAAVLPPRLVVPPRSNGLPACPKFKSIGGPGCADSTYP